MTPWSSPMLGRRKSGSAPAATEFKQSRTARRFVTRWCTITKGGKEIVNIDFEPAAIASRADAVT